MDAKVIELPNWQEQQRCKDGLQHTFNLATTKGFQRQNKMNIKLWLVIIGLFIIAGYQQIQIYNLQQNAHKIIVVDNQTDITGLPAVPLEELK